MGCPDIAGASFVVKAYLSVELRLHTEDVLSRCCYLATALLYRVLLPVLDVLPILMLINRNVTDDRISCSVHNCNEGIYITHSSKS